MHNLTNANIRQAKRDFIFGELETHDKNQKKIWKVIRKVVPSGKSDARQDILLKDNGLKVEREGGARFINDYFINVGNVEMPDAESLHSLDQTQALSD